MSALPPIADIHRLVPELLLQQKQHAHGFYTRGPFSLLMCGSNYFSVASWIGSAPTRPTTLIVVIRAISRCTGRCGTCGSGPTRASAVSDNPTTVVKPRSAICRAPLKPMMPIRRSDGGLVARGSLAILLTIRRASSLLSSERNRSKRILI